MFSAALPLSRLFILDTAGSSSVAAVTKSLTAIRCSKEAAKLDKARAVAKQEAVSYDNY